MTSIAELGPEVLVELVARALRLTTVHKPPLKLPAGMAARHRICTDMASAIVKDLAYPGECGYSQLLYPTEASSRALLGFLVEKLPRSEEEVGEVLEGQGPGARIMAGLAAAAKVR